MELHRTYFRLLADAAETGLFDCLSHPDLIKNETPADWRPELVMDDIQRALDRIAATGVAMELNTSGVKKRIPEMNPFPDMLVEMARREIPVVIGADAHNPERVGDGYERALDLLAESGFSHTSHFLNRGAARDRSSVGAAEFAGGWVGSEGDAVIAGVYASISA